MLKEFGLTMVKRTKQGRRHNYCHITLNKKCFKL